MILDFQRLESLEGTQDSLVCPSVKNSCE